MTGFSWELFDVAMRVRATSNRFRQRVGEAEEMIAEFLTHSHRPYVAYSGGKDSQVLLDLVRRQAAIPAVWHDEDWILPETPALIEQVEERYAMQIIRVRERHAADEFEAMFGFFPRCSNPRPVNFEADTWAEIMAHYGFDGVLMGMRRDESTKRRMALKEPMRCVKRDGMWHGSPLAGWKTEDVWAYLISRNVPFHPAYRIMLESGIPLERARVGPVTAVRVWEFGALGFIRQHYPEVWRAFVADNPEVGHIA